MSRENHTAPVEYRTIPCRDGYRAGNDGSIQSCWILGGASPRKGAKWKTLKPILTSAGYYVVCLGKTCEARVATLPIHRLVLEAFIGPRPPGMECRHKDGVRTNNRLDNLAWGTHQENEDDKKLHGSRPRGSHSKCAKVTEDDVAEMLRMHHEKGMTKSAIARHFGLHHSTVMDIISRKNWTHVKWPES